MNCLRHSYVHHTHQITGVAISLHSGLARSVRGSVLMGSSVVLQAGTVRDSMAKSLYSALFDWIVFRINHALFNNRDLEESTKVRGISFSDAGVRTGQKVKEQIDPGSTEHMRVTSPLHCSISSNQKEYEHI